MKRFISLLLAWWVPCGAAAWAAAGPPAMIVPGQYSVSPTGAATYSIPISVVPGTAGMVPALSLEYSSQSGDGLEGIGWSLGGLPSIGRCAQTIAQDSGNHGGVNYNSDDRFCMDGQRLILISGSYGANGSEYRTEIESFSKIIAHGTAGSGPAWFEVHTKAGQTMEFGNTSDSQALAANADGSGSMTTARAWGLNKVSDSVGNYLTVTYNSAAGTDRTINGEIYPLEIDYTGNSTAGISPYNSVRFTYTSRSDLVPLYQGGGVVSITGLLSEIKTYQASNVVYDYKIAYRAGTTTTHSRVTSVTLCDTGGTNCLAPTTFGWQGGEGYLSMTGTSNRVTDLQKIVPGQFTNDGVTGVLPIQSGLCQNSYDSYDGPSFTTTTYSLPNMFSFTPGDTCNFDIVQTIIAPNGATNLLLNEYFPGYLGNGIFIINTVGSPWIATIPLTNAATPAVGGDFNGDGITDIIIGGATTKLWLGQSNGTYPSGTTLTFSIGTAADFDGNGCVDPVDTSSTIHFLSNCHPLQSTLALPSTSGGYSRVFGDFNGDGKTDVLLVNASAAAQLWLSNGSSFTQYTLSYTDWGKYDVVVGDWNGDGKADVLLTVPGTGGHYAPPVTNKFYLSTGNDFVAAVDSGNNPVEIATGMDGDSAVAADWNSDGATDIWLQRSSRDGGNMLYTFAFIPELMTTVSNGVGSVTTVTYDRLNKNTFYIKGSSATYPTEDIDGPLYVVKEVDASNGLGACAPPTMTYCYTSTYSYSGAQVDVNGRGFLGFAETVITDTQTNVVQTTDYSTTFPYIGMVTQQTKTHSGTTLNSLSNTLANSTSSCGSISALTGVYFVKVSTSVAASHDLDGTAFPTTTTNYTYDACGNPLTIDVSVSDGSSKDTTNTYSDNTSTAWYLGRLATTAVNSIVGSSNLTRHSSFGYDATTGLLTQEVVESGVSTCNNGSSSCTLTTAYSYDVFGHRISTMASGSGIANRTTTASYDPLGEFQTSATNALGQSEFWAYDARFGTPTSHTGPNGLTTTWAYDSFGRSTQELRPDGTRTTSSYAYCGGSCPTYGQFYSQSKILTPGGLQGGPISAVYYDMLSRVVAGDTQGFDGSNIRVATVYDGNGRVNKTSRPYFTASPPCASSLPCWTTNTYDDLGRVTQATFPDSSHADYGFSGLVTTVTRHPTSGVNQVTTTTKNAQGLVANVQDAAGKTTLYVYDAFGNLLTVTDPLGNVVRNDYDIRGNKITSSDPDMGRWTYAYDVLGELTSQVDANGNTTSLTYDLLGRPASRTESGLYSSWTYGTSGGIHNVGRLIEAKACLTNSCGTVFTDRRFVYDSQSRPSQVLLSTGANNYAYYNSYNPDNGQLAVTIYPSGLAVNHIYNQYGYLCRLTDYHHDAPTCSIPPGGLSGTQVYATVNSRDAELHLTGFTAGNGVATTQSFDPETGLIENQRAGSSGSVSSFDYSFDAIGNLTSRTDNDATGGAYTEKFCYDSINRLIHYDIGSTCTSSGYKEVTYDDIGNITKKSDTCNTSSCYVYANGKPHAVSGISGTVDGLTNPQYVYDNNGNLTCVYDAASGSCAASSSARHLSITSFNMAAEVTQGTTSAYFVYDDQHQRVSQVTTATGASPPTTVTTYLNDAASGAMSIRTVAGTMTSPTTWTLYTPPPPTGGPNPHWGAVVWYGPLPNNVGSWFDYVTLDGQIVAQRKSEYNATSAWGQLSWTSNPSFPSPGPGPYWGGGSTPMIWTAYSPPPPTGGPDPHWNAAPWGGIGTLPTVTLYYLSLDHLGSVAVITNSSGTVQQHLSYDPWGKARNPNGTDTACGNITNSYTTRGFTNQEQMPIQCIVNLNARLYDPSIGKFLSADPVVGDSLVANAFNRYAYVLNNPLSFTDPSGLCVFGCFWKQSWFAPIFDIFLVVIGLPELEGFQVFSAGFQLSDIGLIGLIGNGAAAGAATAGISGGNILKGALVGGLEAGLFYEAGNFLAAEADAGTSLLGSPVLDKFVSHGLVGGIGNLASGGNFGSGFLSAGFSSFIPSPGGGETWNRAVAGAVESAVIGGAASILGGGKFENGAITGAFGYLFNFELHRTQLSDFNPEDSNISESELREVQALARLVFAEAANSPDAYAGVGWSVVNRVGAQGFADSLQGVIYQLDGNGNYQYNAIGGKLWNAAGDPGSLTGANATAYRSAYATAFGIEVGRVSDPTGGAKFFYSGATPTGFFSRAISSGRLVPTYTAGPFTFLKAPQ